MPIPIGQILLKEGAITNPQLEEAIQAQVIYGGKLGTNLMELDYINVATLSKVLSKKFNLPPLNNALLNGCSKEVIQILDKNLAHKYRCIPLSIDGSKLKVVMEDPTDFSAIDEISFITGKRIIPYVAPELIIISLLEKHYGIQRDLRYIRISQRDSQTLHKPTSAPQKQTLVKTNPAKAPPAPPTIKEPVKEALPGKTPLHEEVIEEDIIIPEIIKNETVEDELIDLEELVYEAPTIDLSEMAIPATPVEADAEEEEILEDLEVIEELPEALSLQEAIERLDEVGDRDELSRVVLSFALGYFKRSALFITRFGTAVGWDGMGGSINKQVVQSTMLPLNAPSIFKTVHDTQSFFLGGIPKSPINDRFIQVMGGENPDSVFLIPILFKGQVVNILYGDNGDGEKAPFDISDLLILAPKIPQAFEKLIRRRKDEILSDS